jgi:hypothetical protein
MVTIARCLSVHGILSKLSEKTLTAQDSGEGSNGLAPEEVEERQRSVMDF